MEQRAHPPLICDHAEAERFLAALDQSAKGFTFQTFDDDADRKSPALARIIHGTLQERSSQLAELNERGAGVFVTINRTDLKGRKRENVIAVRAAFVDFDGAPIDPIVSDTELPQPHILNETSFGRWHAYWLTNDLALDQFTSVQKALIDRFKSDPSVHDLPRVMRLPGFIHHKLKAGIASPPFMSRIVNIATDVAPYPAEVLLTALRGRRCDLFTGGTARGSGPSHRGDREPLNSDATRPEKLNAYPSVDEKQVEAALKVIPATCDDKTWAVIAKAVHAGLGEDGWPIFHAWSKTGGASYKGERDCRRKWNSSQKSFTEIGVGTLFYLAEQADPTWRAEWWQHQQGDSNPDDVPTCGDNQQHESTHNVPKFSEESLALQFAERHTATLRHVAKWRRWLQWDGARWITDDTVFAFDLARKICREAAAQCNKLNEAKVLASAKTVAAVERLAKADRRLAATTQQWDTKAFLLNEGDRNGDN
jgi:primase-like protein/D5-like protein/DNA primase RepB-like protein